MVQVHHKMSVNNLAPDQFAFWLPASGRTVKVGPEQREVPLPAVPLPINITDPNNDPSDNAIGQGAYDYLRRFPDCEHNLAYAELLRDAYPHLLTDLAAHAVLLDAKEVDPAYVFRKLTALKILRLLEPANKGLLHQLSHGFYELALTFTELPNCRRYLLEAMRAAHALYKLDPNDVSALNLLAELDMLFCDYPSAAARWQQLLPLINDPDLAERIETRIAVCLSRGMPDHTRVDDLEAVGQAMQLYAAKNFSMATMILERLEENGLFLEEFPSAEFFYLLGMCRLKTEDRAGAIAAFDEALKIDPGHQPSRDALGEL